MDTDDSHNGRYWHGPWSLVTLLPSHKIDCLNTNHGKGILSISIHFLPPLSLQRLSSRTDSGNDDDDKDHYSQNDEPNPLLVVVWSV